MFKKMTSDKVLKYKSTRPKDEFAKELARRVNNYFKEKNISKFADSSVVVKSILGFALWIVVYGLIMSNALSFNFWLLLVAFITLGFINIFLAFNIMHDACHEAFSENKKINYLGGFVLNFIGGNQYLFAQMHNAHHSFVNIAGIDVTLETHGIFRFTPHEPWQPKHRWQHIYGFFIYAFGMIHWLLVKDFKWMFGELNIGNRKNIQHPFSEYVILFASKAFYFLVTLVLPLIFLDCPWHWTLIAWVNIHILPSLAFLLLFQVTHIYEGTHFPIPDEDGNIENNYFIHVLETTADFSTENKFVTWLTGGINIHVVHHLYPHINHVHYIPLTRIIKQTAIDHGIQYRENKNFWTALRLHYKMLKLLGKKDAVVPQYGSSASLV